MYILEGAERLRSINIINSVQVDCSLVPAIFDISTLLGGLPNSRSLQMHLPTVVWGGT